MHQIQNQDTTELNCHPVLKAALSSLDLDLESELSRYRKLKRKNTHNSDYKPSTPQVIPLESFDLTAIAGLVHQPDLDLTRQHQPENSAPDDYLESSARLLQSLKNDELFGEKERVLLNPVKTPWGISSVLMLFLGGSLWVFAFIPQSIWAKVPLVKNLVITNSNNPVFSPKKAPTPVDNSNLSESEFLSINLHNLSTLKVKTKPKPVIKPPKKESITPPLETLTENKSKPQPSSNQDLVTALLSPVINQENISPQKNTEKEITVTSSSQLNNKYYYVFSEYKGDKTLVTARQVIKDAYVVKFPAGKRIQLGAFDNQNDAKNLVESLKSRGISASVFNP